jgi:hypothetical protein
MSKQSKRAGQLARATKAGLVVLKNAPEFVRQPELTQWNLVLAQTLSMPWGDGLEATTLCGYEYRDKRMTEWLDQTFSLRAEQVIGCTRSLGLLRAISWCDSYLRNPVADVESVLYQIPEVQLLTHFPSCSIGLAYVCEGIMSRQGHAQLASWPEFAKYLREQTGQSNLTIDTVGILIQMIQNGGTMSGTNRVTPKQIIGYFRDPNETLDSLGFCRAT